METEAQVVARHKKEARDLVAALTGMKKQANKKNRKEVNRRCEEKQREADERWAQELAAVRGDAGAAEAVGAEAETAEADTDTTPEALLRLAGGDEAAAETAAEAAAETASAAAPRKPNRAKAKLAKRAAAMEQLRAEAAAEASTQVDHRAIELEHMAALLAARGLTLHEVVADGHCLFASIADQLHTTRGVEVAVAELRAQAAARIRAHRDEYAPFLFDEETMTVRDVDEYTAKIEHTVMWGGDMEILALAQHYDAPVEVLMSGRAPLVLNAGASGEGWTLAYYKHAFGLGEHYNSVRA